MNPEANLDNEGCIPVLLGCTDEEAYNFDVNANTNDDSCEAIYIWLHRCYSNLIIMKKQILMIVACYPIIFGCTDDISYLI